MDPVTTQTPPKSVWTLDPGLCLQQGRLRMRVAINCVFLSCAYDGIFDIGPTFFHFHPATSSARLRFEAIY